MKADIHTHILPSFDDGASSIDMSVKMLEMLRGDGVTDVVLTPHFCSNDQSITDFLEKRNAAFQALLPHCPDGISLHLGAEVEFSEHTRGYDDLKRLSIDNGVYILLELPQSFSQSLIAKLESFVNQTELSPIIAHVENYAYFQKNPEALTYLADVGCFMQMNTSTIIHNKGSSFANAIICHGLLHLMGTDCRDTDTHSPNFGKAWEALLSAYGRHAVKNIEDNSECVIQSFKIRSERTSNIHKSFGRYK